MPSQKSAGFEPAILDRLVNNLDVNLQGYAAYRVAPKVSLWLAPSDVPTISYVIAGAGGVRIGARMLPVEPWSIIVVPAGQGLAWGSGAEISTPQAEHIQPIDQTLVSLMRTRRPLDEMVVITGRVSASYGPGVGLFDHLREPIIDRLDQDDSVRFAFELLITEIASPDIGSRTMVDACLQQFVILFFRRYLRVENGSPLVHKGLLDRQLAVSVMALTDHPEFPHTIKSMSHAAGMSRTAFAKRFGDAFGQSPLDYVHTLRMQLAARLLTDLQVKVIGGRVGYSSRSYFSRAFRAHFGLDPSAFRLAKSNRLRER